MQRFWRPAPLPCPSVEGDGRDVNGCDCKVFGVRGWSVGVGWVDLVGWLCWLFRYDASVVLVVWLGKAMSIYVCLFILA